MPYHLSQCFHNTILFKIITRIKLLFSNYLGCYSYRFRARQELISVTVTVLCVWREYFFTVTVRYSYIKKWSVELFSENYSYSYIKNGFRIKNVMISKRMVQIEMLAGHQFRAHRKQSLWLTQSWTCGFYHGRKRKKHPSSERLERTTRGSHLSGPKKRHKHKEFCQKFPS